MTIGTALRTHLLADPAIAALVGTRVYSLRLPQKATFPAIVLTRVSEIRFAHLRGPGGLARPRFQVDGWAQTHDQATQLGTLCRLRLAGYAGTWSDAESPQTTVSVKVQFESAMDLFEEEILGGLCRHSADYFLFHGTAENTV